VNQSNGKIEITKAKMAAISAVLVAIIGGVFALRGTTISSSAPIDATRTAEARRPLPASCYVAGTVFNDDDKQPFQGVRVGYVPDGSSFADEELFTHTATSGPDGKFEFDCSSVAESYPVVIALADHRWGGCILVTDQQIRPKRATENINVYVSDKVQALLGDLWGTPKNSNCER
jgi:hypothetical protein